MNKNRISEIIQNEVEVNRLVEERGIGASEYNDIINDIVAECQKYIQNNPKNAEDFNGWHFYISDELTSRSSIFDKLVLEIKIEDFGDKPLNQFGTGGALPSNDLSREVKNGRFVTLQYIRITGISHGKELYPQTIYNSLYHELNHKIDDLHRAANYGYGTRPLLQGDFYKLVKSTTFSDDNNVNDAIHFTVYRVFITTELNALTSGVYSDLKGIDSERKNWKQDIQKTQAYTIYLYLKKYYKILLNANISAFSKLKSLFDGSVAQGYKKDINAEDFKKWFLGTLLKRMNILYKNIGRAASLWYDDKEKSSEHENVGELLEEDEDVKVYMVGSDEFKKFIDKFNKLINY